MADGTDPVDNAPSAYHAAGVVPTTRKPHSASAKRPTSVIDWFARNPRIGLLGTIASLVGVPISVYLFFASQELREVVYAFSASPTSIVKAGQTSGLRVFFRDLPVNEDVSGVQVEIWNVGKQSVRTENILSRTVTIHLGKSAHILSAIVKRQTRSLVGFQCQQLSPEALGCSWSILERGDGGLVELIYSGQGGQILVTGDIEGRAPIRRIVDLDKFASKVAEPFPVRYAGWAFVVMSLFMFLGSVLAYRRVNRFTRIMRRLPVALSLALFLYGGAMLFAGGWILYHQYTSVAPFPL